MKCAMRRLMSLLLAMVMAFALAVPVLAEELDAPPAAEIAAAAELTAPSEESREQQDADSTAGTEDPAPAQEPAEDSAPTQESGEESAPAQETIEDAAPAQESGKESAPAQEIAEEQSLSPLTLKTLESARLPVDGALSYESSDSTVATVDERGKVTACHVGSADILVSTASGQTLTCAVTIPVTTTTTEAELSVGGTTDLKLKKRTLAQAESGDRSIATVNEQGRVKAKQSGVVDLTLTDTLGDRHIVTLKVKAVLSQKEVTVSEENTVQLELMGSDIIRAQSSDADVATVDEDGNVTALQEGTAVVTLTDESGSKSKCEVTVEPNYLARTAKNAKRIYRKIETLGCRHVSGVHTYEQMVKRRHATCTTGASLALQAAGVLDKGKWITHTDAGGEGRKLRNPDKAIRRRKDLKKGTYTLYKANCRYSKLPDKYKQAGMVYIQDSNICVSAGNGYIYSCNQSSRQYRHGHYFNTKVKSGYTHHHKILYVIAPNS